jgi:hypothetical protein
MADELEFKIDTSQLDAALSKLPDKVQKRIVVKALQQAGDVMLEAVKAQTPEQTDEPTPGSDALPPGILREDMTTEVTVSETKGARLRVGPTEIAGYVARWINNGWMLTSHDGRKIREIPGKHFMESAFDESAQAALDAMTDTIADGIENYNEEE